MSPAFEFPAELDSYVPLQCHRISANATIEARNHAGMRTEDSNEIDIFVYIVTPAMVNRNLATAAAARQAHRQQGRRSHLNNTSVAICFWRARSMSLFRPCMMLVDYDAKGEDIRLRRCYEVPLVSLSFRLCRITLDNTSLNQCALAAEFLILIPMGRVWQKCVTKQFFCLL
jgi:hypothetical protein